MVKSSYSPFCKVRKQNTPLLWVASDAQLADGLTKSAAGESLLHFLQRGQLWVVKYDPEFIAAKRKKAKGLSEPRVDETVVPTSDCTWQQLISRHDSTISSENLWGMSVFLIQPVDSFASNGGTCHTTDACNLPAGFFSNHIGTPLANPFEERDRATVSSGPLTWA